MNISTQKKESNYIRINFDTSVWLCDVESPNYFETLISQESISTQDYTHFLLSFDYVYTFSIGENKSLVYLSKTLDSFNLQITATKIETTNRIELSGICTKKIIEPLKASKLIEVIINEVRNPIVGLVATSDLYINYGKEFNLDHMEYFGITRDYAQKLSKFIDQVIYFLKLENNEIEYSESPIHIKTIIEQVIKANSVNISDASIQIDKSISNELFCLGNEELIHIALRNILLNASFYCESKPLIKISTHKLNQFQGLTFKDNGLGIQPEIAFDIFKHFYRFHKIESKKHSEGIGLGLSLVKEIMIHQKGKIHINSTQHTGTQVTLYFPQLATIH